MKKTSKERKVREVSQATLVQVLFTKVSPRRTRLSMYRITVGFLETPPLVSTNECQRKEI